MNDIFWAAFGGGAAGGIVSLIAAAFVEWLRWINDRSLLKVKANVSFLVCLGYTGHDLQISLTAINPHSKPVTLSGVGLGFRVRKIGRIQITVTRILYPYTLEGGKSASKLISIKDVADTLKRSTRIASELGYAWFSSSTDAEYKRDLHKNLIANIQKEFERS